jgi:hypothetical protein
MSQEHTGKSSGDPYACELSLRDDIEQMVANVEGRYVLIAPDAAKAAEGDALFYDAVNGIVSWIDEGDKLHREVVQRMLEAGVRVFPSYDDARAAVRPAT